VNWPNDADGDVFRRLQQSNFDFDRRHLIDFDVDFEDWPPQEEAIELLKREFPTLKVYAPNFEDEGYLQFQVHEFVSYELVVRIQEHVTELMKPYGGTCESWGILH
jgi:hypothetical protein